jgi:hypothetical protein
MKANRHTIILTGTLALLVPSAVAVSTTDMRDPVTRLQVVRGALHEGDRPVLSPRGDAATLLLAGPGDSFSQVDNSSNSNSNGK